MGEYIMLGLLVGPLVVIMGAAAIGIIGLAIRRWREF